MSITLAELKLQARQRADMENSTFISEPEIRSYINNSIAELYDLMCEAYGAEYYIAEPVEISVTSGTAAYDLPDGTLYSSAPAFYELKGVDIKLDNQDYVNVPRFNWNDRNRDASFTVFDLLGTTNIRYRIMGDKIRLSPVPDVNATLRVWYVPLPTQLVDEDDELQDFNAYSEYVIVDTAIKMLQKEESDEAVATLMAQKVALAQRIRDKAAQRDASEADTITDRAVQDEDVAYYRRF